MKRIMLIMIVLALSCPVYAQEPEEEGKIIKGIPAEVEEEYEEVEQNEYEYIEEETNYKPKYKRNEEKSAQANSAQAKSSLDQTGRIITPFEKLCNEISYTFGIEPEQAPIIVEAIAQTVDDVYKYFNYYSTLKKNAVTTETDDYFIENYFLDEYSDIEISSLKSGMARLYSIRNYINHLKGNKGAFDYERPLDIEQSSPIGNREGIITAKVNQKFAKKTYRDLTVKRWVFDVFVDDEGYVTVKVKNISVVDTYPA